MVADSQIATNTLPNYGIFANVFEQSRPAPCQTGGKYPRAPLLTIDATPSNTYNNSVFYFLTNTSMFGKIGDMYRLQKQAKEIKKELKLTHIESDHHGVKVTVDGEQHVVNVEILDDSLLSDKRKLCNAYKEATNRATEKSQKIAAEKMKGVMGEMGFPGA